jgi:hypothetical protein
MGKLNLRAGEWIEVRSKEEILQTLDKNSRLDELSFMPQRFEGVRVKSYQAILATCEHSDKNRGMKFDAEMVPYCGRTYRVLRRVTKILNEKTGKMQELKNSCIILDCVVCQSRYCECRLFCPRSIYPYWREIWLERLSKDGSDERERPSPKSPTS